jgi:hypothetical protein
MKGNFQYNHHTNHGIYPMKLFYLNENYPEENPSEKPVMLPALLIDICHRNGPDIGIATYLTDDEVLKLKGNGLHTLFTKFMYLIISTKNLKQISLFTNNVDHTYMVPVRKKN